MSLLNDKQRHCYDVVMSRIKNGCIFNSNGIFLNAPGGTGKSFVLNMLLDSVRSQGKIALAVASSGIAATALHGGRTAHNMFKNPLMEYNEIRTCGIKKNSELARLLQMTSLIIWDEVVMANKNTLTALDITLRDILGNNKFMGGIVFVCAGDFRQILPVIRGGGKNEEIDHCIKSSYFWEGLTKLELTENVRLNTNDVENKSFAKSLLGIGTGETGPVRLPRNFGIKVKTRKDLVKKV
ncbi:ATP-dependent DNA helicase Pif1-like [Oratosquilla oratoria]|uniref:ATP-dependent DNA helicase Pif1-like n=1 Tax=Oratosquilla oratoria TaxID=337810 RepID=UPI003F757EF7